ncbi:hypothetical protein G7Z17_g11385 [Cylindrodendrum hubeiense]|uniref:GIY-YIG domain-containing protein n=1 Tax=Cylindrodendrum hubeiense TaxID=595255 RepID=A0A9P5GZN3_9HYPO|nr:hypothetical protein G7Z17_g11385 [Cylindrodendrum hubeiense]
MVKLRTFRVTKPLTESEAQDIKATTQNAGSLVPLLVGQLGFIPDIASNFSQAKKLAPLVWVQLIEHTHNGWAIASNTPAPDGKCMVPSSHIELGAEQTSTKPIVSDLVLGNATLRVSPNHPESPLHTWLESFYASLGTDENLAAMKEIGVPDRVLDMVGKSGKRAALIREFLDGMAYCGTLEPFRNGLPTLQQIWNNAKYVRRDAANPSEFNRTTGSFFYMICYFDQTSEVPEYAVYCGQSVDPTKRLQQHNQSLMSDDNDIVAHHKIGRKILRKGGNYRMFPITFISRMANDYSVMGAWAELTLIILFECFNPFMLTIEEYREQSGLAPSSSTDLVINPDRETFHKAWSSPLANRTLEIGKRLKASRAALERFSPRDKFTGCNWAVPVLERTFMDSNLWVQTTILRNDLTPRMWQFRTHPRRVQGDRQVIVFIGTRNVHAKTVPRAFKVPLPLTIFPSVKKGSIVNVVIEIMANPAEKHPYPYVEIPAIGPFDCWREASRVGIRVEFLEDGGTWKARYLANYHLQTFKAGIKALKPQEYGPHGDIFACIEVGWLHCIKILATLLQWKWQPEESMLTKRVWVPYNGRVRKYDVDFFNQRINLSDPQAHSKPIPRLLSLDQTSTQIEQKYGYDVHIGHFPGKELLFVPGEPAGRMKCDICCMGVQDGEIQLARRCGKRRVIDNKEGFEMLQCEFSASLGRYCTFTAGIKNKPELYDLVYHNRQPYLEMAIPAPQNVMQFLELRDEEEAMPAEEAEDNGDED